MQSPTPLSSAKPSRRQSLTGVQLGMDQREVNVLAREYCDDIKPNNKPIILSHHMLHGLLKGQEKVSKSDSFSTIFMEDEEVAWCGFWNKNRHPGLPAVGGLTMAKWILITTYDYIGMASSAKCDMFQEWRL